MVARPKLDNSLDGALVVEVEDKDRIAVPANTAIRPLNCTVTGTACRQRKTTDRVEGRQTTK